MRLFPTSDEKIELQRCLEQYRWYYNLSLAVVSTHFTPEQLIDQKHSYHRLREIINRYKYTETVMDNVTTKSYEYNEDNNTIEVPEWWKGKSDFTKKPLLHSRTPRGAIKKITGNLNSAIANLKNGNIRKFHMHFMTKKSNTDYLLYEDLNFPVFIRKIKSHYWFRNKNRKRTKISFSDITSPKKGIEISYEKKTGRYFLYYPVPIDWYPEDDKRNDNQERFEVKGDRIIALDPGIRKFLVGYDPKGTSVFIGEGANKKLIELLYNVDKEADPHLLWTKIKNYVNEMHWKSISYLVENYDTIIYPDFRVSQMIRSKKLTKMTKRLMSMYSFHSFRTKLEYKCSKYNKKLIIVDESYTSCTCGRCGHINNVRGNEVFHCVMCEIEMDRDASGSRNILLKHLIPKRPTLGPNHDSD
jgi:IS605 OrfB family transposase